MAISTIKYENSLNITPTYTASSSVTVRSLYVHRCGSMVAVDLYFDVTTALSNNTDVITFTQDLPKPCSNYAFAVIRSIGGNIGSVSIERVSANKIRAWGTVPVGTYYYAQIVYMV